MSKETRDDLEESTTPDARRFFVNDVDAVFDRLVREEADLDNVKRALWRFMRVGYESRRFSTARAYLEKILSLEGDSEQRAVCFLLLGGSYERERDYVCAAEAYSRAFTLPVQANETWYFLQNNLGYSLNQTGHQDQAEAHCRAAIAIDPTRHNAYKNLGVALEGLGRPVEAALSFIKAALAFPRDSRALRHLEDLLSRHPEVGRNHSEIAAGLRECREAARL
ncbi:MAG: tetratricopeptide repeat protein [Deltaproteobacteria bacterium]|nr:tetratricopeptide repeat protein [Deltaproteobacteria bacterium]